MSNKKQRGKYKMACVILGAFVILTIIGVVFIKQDILHIASNTPPVNSTKDTATNSSDKNTSQEDETAAESKNSITKNKTHKSHKNHDEHSSDNNDTTTDNNENTQNNNNSNNQNSNNSNTQNNKPAATITENQALQLAKQKWQAAYANADDEIPITPSYQYHGICYHDTDCMCRYREKPAYLFSVLHIYDNNASGTHPDYICVYTDGSLVELY